VQLSASWLLSSRYEQEILHQNVTSTAAGLLANYLIQYNSIVIITLSWKTDSREGGVKGYTNRVAVEYSTDRAGTVLIGSVLAACWGRLIISKEKNICDIYAWVGGWMV